MSKSKEIRARIELIDTNLKEVTAKLENIQIKLNWLQEMIK